MSLFDTIYRNSPVWIQNAGISLYGLVWKNRRLGGNFKQYVEEFQAREQFRLEDWVDYQTTKLRQLLVYARENVPYYQNALDAFPIEDLAEIRIQDLSELPVLEKEDLRREQTAFLTKLVSPKGMHTYHTSGTTGTPVAIQFTSDMHQLWYAAYEVRVRKWAGINHHMSRAMIGGRLVVPAADSNPPFWRYNLAEKQLYLSAFHISPENTEAYVDAFNRYHPDYYVGYASSYYFLARFINEGGYKVHQPKAVLTSSEKLTDEMRQEMEQAFQCHVFDGYSGVEACCLASECEHHNLHLSPDVGIVELLDADGKPVQPGEVGEIVATGLLNFEQPLIRYRTGDYAVLFEEACECGRVMPILGELVGRVEDTVIGADGRELVRFHGIFVGLPNILEGQVIQETIRDFTLRLVATPDFGQHEKDIIIKRFDERLGEINLNFEFVETIERTERGKFRAVISKVDRVYSE